MRRLGLFRGNELLTVRRGLNSFHRWGPKSEMHKLTDNRKIWGWSALLAGSLLLSFVLFPLPCIWLRMPGARVSIDGKLTTDVAVYRSCDGQLLIRMPYPNGDVPYVVRSSTGEIVLTNNDSLLGDNPDDGHWLITNGFALSREAHPRGEVLGSCYFDIDSQVTIRPGDIAFTEENLSPERRGWRACRVRIQF